MAYEIAKKMILANLILTIFLKREFCKTEKTLVYERCCDKKC